MVNIQRKFKPSIQAIQYWKKDFKQIKGIAIGPTFLGTGVTFSLGEGNEIFPINEGDWVILVDNNPIIIMSNKDFHDAYELI